MARLSPSQVDAKLKPLKGWRRKGDFITKTFKFRTFMGGIEFVDDVAEIAEGLDHHPDIHIVWTTIKLEIQTHDEGGITQLDIRLASRVEDYLARKKAEKS
jgi:4a-hydroxytetrahydrobiopterin dehydratase